MAGLKSHDAIVRILPESSLRQVKYDLLQCPPFKSKETCILCDDLIQQQSMHQKVAHKRLDIMVEAIGRFECVHSNLYTLNLLQKAQRFDKELFIKNFGSLQKYRK